MNSDIICASCMDLYVIFMSVALCRSTFTYLALRSSGRLWDNGQQVSPAHTVGCHCLFLAPADSYCLYIFSMLIAKSFSVDLIFFCRQLMSTQLHGGLGVLVRSA